MGPVLKNSAVLVLSAMLPALAVFAVGIASNKEE